ncbi:hypothetical protein BO86DRAFT_384328 [Aspergillus japonicus CBS 114.51]|uniref:Uncharacterized protein n=1 Tax=Aspergillus japonicus CBS 114.51 TaxID=1448312 RepID=A0A8T8WJ91_ASPJA|nr:hypothetical protein BO86DRAFT_384328 [Aspergillus japonicus CBS 114.51]RAH75871.1 hypothetical protein BO86DRAFT_384328 [Aspergillus japonicus CBS 114.51]
MHLALWITIPAVLYKARCLTNRHYARWFRHRVHRDVYCSLAVLVYGLLLLYYLLHLGGAILALSQSPAPEAPHSHTTLTLTLPDDTGTIPPPPTPLRIFAMAVDDFDRHGSGALQRHGDLRLLLQS